MNFVWEMAQMGGFTGLPANPIQGNLTCAIASLGDGLLVLLIWAAGALVFRRVAWVRRAGPREWLMLLGSAAAVGIGVEVVFVHPNIPFFNMGLIPILQMPLLAPPVLWWASRFASCSLGALNPP